MESMKSCSVDLVDPLVTFHQSASGLFRYMSRKILFATEGILTEGAVILPFRWPTTTWVSLLGTGLLSTHCLNRRNPFFQLFFSQDTPWPYKDKFYVPDLPSHLKYLKHIIYLSTLALCPYSTLCLGCLLFSLLNSYLYLKPQLRCCSSGKTAFLWLLLIPYVYISYIIIIC